MQKILELITQRRIWAGIFATITFIAPVLGLKYNIEGEVLTDLFTNLGLAIANLGAVVMPIISYFFPKKKSKR